MKNSPASLEFAGPRPRRRLFWQSSPGQRRPGVLRLIDQSFPVRLLLALVAAGALLGAVERWENCRSEAFSRGCLQSNAEAIISVANVEALSIVTAALLYLLEGGPRRQRENREAMGLILECQQAGARLSHSRNEALEKLSAQGIWLDGLDLSHTQLERLRAPHGRWRAVNLHKASLKGACLEDSDLQGADLSGADLRQARLAHADLRGADLRGADLREADLRGSDLRQARMDGARLEGARLDGADLGDAPPIEAASAIAPPSSGDG